MTVVPELLRLDHGTWEHRRFACVFRLFESIVAGPSPRRVVQRLKVTVTCMCSLGLTPQPRRYDDAQEAHNAKLPKPDPPAAKSSGWGGWVKGVHARARGVATARRTVLIPAQS